jgi:protocatechuate 3,4-dioxygenase beta subunit
LSLHNPEPDIVDHRFSPDRRLALQWLGLGALAAATGCGTSGQNYTGSSAATGSTGSTGTTGTTGATGTTGTTGSTGTTGTTGSTGSTGATGTTGSCAITPEGEEGPYFVADTLSGFFRSNITTNIDGSSPQTGIPLNLNLYVYDSKSSCAAMQNVQVDIWHCNAEGVYSDESSESTSGQTWLRGYQITDANGFVSFTTIIPGWYQGRTTHIHLRLRSTYDSSSTGGTNTTQLFFSQTLIDTIDQSSSGYSTHGINNTTNAGDRVYTNQTLGENLMSLTGNTTDGYTTTFAIHLPITAE